MKRAQLSVAALVATTVFASGFVAEVQAAGRLAGAAPMSRGGAIHRGGPAAGGSFAARDRGQGAQRQDSIAERQEDRREDWQDHRDEVREDRQDFIEDELDGDRDWDRDDDWGEVIVAGAVIAGTAAVVGAAAASTRHVYYNTLPCTATTLIVGGITYFRCGSIWYSQIYAANGISYAMVQAPPGY